MNISQKYLGLIAVTCLTILLKKEKKTREAVLADFKAK